jgi:OFA family oxalate/formate antiporter-like MFS transporter
MAREVAGAPPAPAAVTSRKVYFGYWLIGAAFVAQFVSVGSQNYVVGAFLKPMTDDLGWTRAEFTYARTIAQVIMAFTGFFIGAHVDRRGGRALMLIGITILSTALFSLSFVEQLWHWILINGLIMTVGAAMIGNLVVNVTLSKWFVEKRGLAVALASMGVSMAGVLLTPAMTRVIDEWGWRAGWRFMGVGALILIVPVAFLMRRAPEDYGLHPDGKTAAQVAAGGGQKANADFASSLTRREALHTVSFYMLVLAFGMFGLTIGVMLLHTIPFMTDAGYSRSTAAFMITLASIPALASKPFWGLLMDKTDPKRLASISALITGAAILLITTSVRSETNPLVWSGFLLLGFGWGGMIPLQELIWATFFGRRHLGSVRSAGLPFSLFLGAGAPLLVSEYVDRVGDYNGAFFTVAGLNVAAAVLLLFIRKPTRREAVEAA